MDLKAGASIHNRFDIRVIRDGNVIQEAHAENIVLDRMYTRICSFSKYFDYIHFGTGTGALSPTRTTLFTPTSYKPATTVEAVYAFPTSKITRKIQIMPEEYVGTVFTEVGISESTSYINTHALIKDSEGVNISITKTELDLIEVYATVYVELQDNPSTGAYWTGIPQQNSMLNYLIGLDPGNLNKYSDYVKTHSTSGVLPDNVTGTSIACTLQNSSVNKTITWPITRYDVNTGNSTIRRVSVPRLVTFDVTKNSSGMDITNESLGTGDGSTNAYAINKSDISNIVVKVDGVENSEYTISKPIYSKFSKQYTFDPGLSSSGGTVRLFDDNPEYGIQSPGTSSSSTAYITKMGGRNLVTYLKAIPTTCGEPGYLHAYYPLTCGFFYVLNNLYYSSNTWFRTDLYRYNFETGEFNFIYSPTTAFNAGNNPYWHITVSKAGSFVLSYYGSSCTMRKVLPDNTVEAVTITNKPKYPSKYGWISDDICYIGSNGAYSVFKYDGTSFVLTASFNTGYDATYIETYKDSILIRYGTNFDLRKIDLATGVLISTTTIKTFSSTRIPSITPKIVDFKDGYIGVFLYNSDSSSFMAMFSVVDNTISAESYIDCYPVYNLIYNGACYGAYYDTEYNALYMSTYSYVYLVECYKDNYSTIVFNTPPATGTAITASYHIPYIKKTADYVLDVGFILQFGEGTV